MLKVYRVLLFTLGAVFLISAGQLTRYAAKSCEQKQNYQQLAAVVENAPVSTEPQPEESGFLPGYEELYRQNNDMVGWIRIEGTNINYPVVQSGQSPNFYLRHDFEKNYTYYGCPYVQESCDVQTPSDNVILYGHNMQDNTMFAELTNYKKRSYWEQHRTLCFDTLTARGEYAVIAAFKGEAAELFPYYDFIDAQTPAEFDAYVAACKALTPYDIDVTASYGDKLITLSTCEYSGENGRMVVVAKRLTQPE